MKEAFSFPAFEAACEFPRPIAQRKADPHNQGPDRGSILRQSAAWTPLPIRPSINATDREVRKDPRKTSTSGNIQTAGFAPAPAGTIRPAREENFPVMPSLPDFSVPSPARGARRRMPALAARHPRRARCRHRCPKCTRAPAPAGWRRLNQFSRSDNVRTGNRVSGIQIVHILIRPQCLLHRALLHDTGGTIRPLPPCPHPKGDDANQCQHQRNHQCHLNEGKPSRSLQFIYMHSNRYSCMLYICIVNTFCK